MDPDVNPTLWRLEVGGLVDHPRSFTLDELKAMPSQEQETTLMCISNPVGGGLISNARWTGVPLPQVLRLCAAKEDAAALLFHAADGYYETIPVGKAFGESTLRRHGCGVYKEQGWGPNFTIPTVSRVDEPLVKNGRFQDPWRAGQTVSLEGVAFGGDRGISAVELSFDHEKTWHRASLVEPGTKISWSKWRMEFKPGQPGETVVAVRAMDGNGDLQSSEERSTVPQGATGLQRVAARVIG